MKLNRPLTLEEKIRFCRQQNEVLPMKGHLRLVLEDVRDGTQKISEQHNLITNAVQSILDHNFNGNARFDSLMPMHNLYGGIFAFERVQTENANNWTLVNDLQNKLVAHAGSLANTGGSTLRGSPVSNETIITDTSISRTWMWDNTQGVGHIESCSLVTALMGNMGTKPFDTDYNPLSMFGNDGAVGGYDTPFTEDVHLRYPFSIDDSGKTSRHIWASGTSFKETTVRHDYFVFGIMRGVRDWQTVATRTATIRAFTANKSFVFDDDDYYYIARATDSTHLQVDKVSKSTFEVTQADCEFSSYSLWTGNVDTTFNGCLKVFAFDGTYLYFPNSLGTGFLALCLADTGDSFALDGTISINKGRLASTTSNGGQFSSPLVINEGLILGDNYIINGDTAYQIAQCKQIGVYNTYLATKSFLWLCKMGASVYGNAFQSQDTTLSAQSNVLCQMFKGTVVNLDSPKDKGTSQTMRITYSLTEQTS